MSTHRLRHPERWWLATARDLPWLTDPDVDDGGQRWDDRDDLDWAMVAEAVMAIWSLLETGVAGADPDDPAAVVVRPPWALPTAEAGVVESWWRPSESPKGDMWSTQLNNGRHRLWNVWRIGPAARLPICSDLLGYMNDVPDMPELAAGIRRSAAEGLQATTPPLLTTNPRHVTELRRVAAPGSRMP